MTSEEIYVDLFKREIEGGCYDVKIDGISLYQFVKRGIRVWILHCHGYEIGYNVPKVVSKWGRRKNIFLSLIQILWLIIRRKKYDNLVYAFPRTEKVKGFFVEKFTDPIIDFSDVGKSFIIFEPTFQGEHRRPRAHDDKIIYTDAINWLAHVIATYKLKKNDALISGKWEELKTKVEGVFPETDLSKTNYKQLIVECLYIVKIYQYIFKRLNVKNFIAPSRPSHLLLLPAAKRAGVKTFELQHGVCYDIKHKTYGGYMDPMFTPDKFLSFGVINKAIYYGISDQDVVNIGWAFNNYLEQIITKGVEKERKEKEVLVVSDGVLKEIQEKILDAIFSFADKNRDIYFTYRPHPEETLSSNQIERIKSRQNVSLDDNTENLLVVLGSFENVIGGNSSGMYDALDMKKKVAKLSLNGLVPKYSTPGDEKYFYEIYDDESFVRFINSPKGEKPYKEHFSPFNSELLNALIRK